MKFCAVVSGGMDSTVAAYLAAEQGEIHTVFSVNYGQRHAKELERAAVTAATFGAKHVIADLRSITPLITSGRDSLTNPDVPVPDGHYTELTMKQTVVSNRNMIIYSVAAGYAAANELDALVLGVHGGDHFIYPDCRPEFITAFDTASRLGTLGHAPAMFRTWAPFVYRDKTAVAWEGNRLGVDWSHTWSCYKGGDIHCGRCGTCVERIEAFALAGVTDPTPYEDRDFAIATVAARGVVIS